MQLLVDKTWDGESVGEEERVELELRRVDDTIEVTVSAPFHGDAPPQAPAGRVDRLWENEVVELFLLGADGHYLEVEFGPHGHYLVLQLCGERQVERWALLLEYEAEISRTRWSGKARFPAKYLPPEAARCNAYAMHGKGEERRYLAAHPVPGEKPDFHRLDCFGPLALD